MNAYEEKLKMLCFIRATYIYWLLEAYYCKIHKGKNRLNSMLLNEVEIELSFYKSYYEFMCLQMRIDDNIEEQFSKIINSNGFDKDYYFYYKHLALENNHAYDSITSQIGLYELEYLDLVSQMAFVYNTYQNVLRCSIHDRIIWVDDKFKYDLDHYFSISEDVFHEVSAKIGKYQQVNKESILGLRTTLEFYNLENPLYSFEALCIDLVDIIFDYIPLSQSFESNEGRYRLLKESLEECNPGFEEWRDFEFVCEQIIEYSFVPQFPRLYFQARSADGHERRDIIIPNLLYSGVWNAIFHQYNSQSLVFEAKNKSTGFTKDVVNQLRIYLSKPTIGRFGFLIVRGDEISANVKQAIRYAYDQSKILIIVLNDNDMNKMMLTKLLFNKVDSFVEFKKVLFEINY